MYAVSGIAPTARSGRTTQVSTVRQASRHSPMTASANPPEPTTSSRPLECGRAVQTAPQNDIASVDLVRRRSPRIQPVARDSERGARAQHPQLHSDAQDAGAGDSETGEHEGDPHRERIVPADAAARRRCRWRLRHSGSASSCTCRNGMTQREHAGEEEQRSCAEPRGREGTGGTGSRTPAGSRRPERPWR